MPLALGRKAWGHEWHPARWRYSDAKAGYRQTRGGCLNSGVMGRYGYRRVRVREVIPMDSKAYSGRKVNQVAPLLEAIRKLFRLHE